MLVGVVLAAGCHDHPADGRDGEAPRTPPSNDPSQVVENPSFDAAVSRRPPPETGTIALASKGQSSTAIVHAGTLPHVQTHSDSLPATTPSSQPRPTTHHTNRWAAVTTPAAGPARSVGGYSNGCVRGAVALPLIGPGYQVARPSRNRHFGHPLLVEFIESLARSVHDQTLGVLFVGDLGQPRGGPAPSGHKSHQTGLDADIWFWYPPAAAKAPLAPTRTEKLSAPRIVDNKGRPNRHFTPRVEAILQQASSEPKVDRIFVNPAIKRELCRRINPGPERAWLGKLRPWWGHDSHFHVRLACPQDSDQCESQGALPPGDGCDQLAWWFDKKAQAERAKNRSRYREGMGEAKSLPPGCRPLVAE